MIAHARLLWPKWGALWFVPPLPWVLYAIGVAAFGSLRWEHVAVAVAAVIAAFGTPASRRFFVAALPLLCLFVAYDALRYVKDVGLSPERVLGCGLHEAELRHFGIGSGDARMTLNDWFQLHHAPITDVLFAIPYGAYIPILVATWIGLYLKDADAARRFGTIVLLVHLMGFVTYHALPAAPPWYIRAHGCAIDLATKPSIAALARVDRLLGVPYFASLYSRSSAVFGALPSLHVTYPVTGLVGVWSVAGKKLRAAFFVYAALMIVGAVYLDHHYVIDVLLGLSYAAIASVVVFAIELKRGGRRVAA